MKRLMMTSAVALCALGLAACGPNSEIDTADTSTASTDAEAADMMADNESADVYGDQTDRYGDVDTAAEATGYQLAATEFEVDDLVGLDISSPTGEKIASVSDLLIGDNGKIDSIIFANGGIAGLGTDHGRIAFDQAKFAVNEDGDARVVVSLTEEGLKNVAEWEQADADDYSLATEITGTEAALGTSGENARIVNLLADMNGSIKYAVVSDDATSTIEGEGYVVPFDALVVEQGDGGLRLDMDEASLKTNQVYRN